MDKKNCVENLIFASEIKKYLVKSVNSSSLSICKYNVLNSKRLFFYYFEKEKYCYCITDQDLNIKGLLRNAEEANELDLCINFSNQFKVKLTSLVKKMSYCN